jgi:hypothetical protein
MIERPSESSLDATHAPSPRPDCVGQKGMVVAAQRIGLLGSQPLLTFAPTG